MKMDPTTELIAHFIGLFELSIEELRLRQDYLEFKLMQNAEDPAPPLETIGVHLQAPYQIGRYDPGLAYEPVAPELPPVDHARAVPLVEYEPLAPPELVPHPPISASYDGRSVVVVQPDFVPSSFSFPLATPGSVVSVTVQIIDLSDNDLFLSGLGTSFTDPAVLEATLAEIVAVAETLVGFDIPSPPQGSDWMGFAQNMLAELETAAPAGNAAEIASFRGAEAQGTIVDGVAVDEAPVWTELLPLHLRPEDEVSNDDPSSLDADADVESVPSDSSGQGHTAEHDFSRDFDDDGINPFKLNPGHEIVAGANKAINEIALGSQWLDAPVIVVRGDVARLDAVSQVNVLVEHDTIDGVAVGQNSVSHNIAKIVTESSEDPAAPAPPDVLPGAWQTVRIEADLIQVNWVKQFTHVSDFDRAELTFSGQATFLGLGENEMVNSAILNELGYNYDLIFVAGDMVDATVVSQKNVLFDTDTIATRDAGAAPSAMADPAAMTAAASRLVAGGSELEAVTVTEPAEARDEHPLPSEAEGGGGHLAASDQSTLNPERGSASFEESHASDGRASETSETAALRDNFPELLTVEAEAEAEAEAFEASFKGTASRPQEPVIGDRDLAGARETDPDAFSARASSADDAQAVTQDAAPAVSLADNLLLNQATIKSTGVDEFVEMREAFAATAESLAEGVETIAREVAQDALFAGKEALRVLQIDGDFAKINIFEQTNIVGDADQIRLEMQALRERLEAEMKLIAGSNALVNLATVTEYGVNSKIMAGGHVYDDAFIYQAELIDTDLAPSGVAVSALAKEAVAAFLSDDMLTSTAVTDEIVPTDNVDASSHLDVMQTALT